MHRRTVLAGAGTTLGAALAGCLGGGPDPEILELLEPGPEVVSVGSNGGEFSATVANTGDGGAVRLELYYLQTESVVLPPNPAPFIEGESNRWLFDGARTVTLDGGEQRRESIVATGERPPDWSDFVVRAFPASYGCVLENTGDGGEIAVRFELIDDIAGVDLPDPRELSLGSGETTELVFDVLIPAGARYEFVAEPA